MGARYAANARTTVRTVPVLDEDTEGRLEDLSGIHPGVDLIRAGFQAILLDRLTRDETQTLISALAGSTDGADVLGLLAATITHLTSYDTNTCLLEMGDDAAKDVRRIGAAAAVELDSYAPRDLAAETCYRIDPYTDPIAP